jgi:carboxymethylenebutenolidase
MTDRDDNVTVLSRRTFAITSLAVGFAAAAGPVHAEVIHTDANGLTAGEVKVPVTDGTIPAYRAKPAKGTHFPTVLVVQEIFGVHEHIKDICRRFAKLGYYAIAPSLYARYGNPAKYTDIRKLIDEVVLKVPDSEVLSDLDSTVAFAQKDGGDTDRMVLTGYCWGGRIAWLYAAHSDKLKAAAAWYGKLRGTPGKLRTAFGLDLAPKLRAPVIGFYGGEDPGNPVSDVEAMRAALAKAGRTKSHIYFYKDAKHGFFADYRASYNEKDAKDAWAKMLAFFKANGVK